MLLKIILSPIPLGMNNEVAEMRSKFLDWSPQQLLHRMLKALDEQLVAIENHLGISAK